MATHQYSCLENPRDSRAWWATVYGVTQSWTRLKRLSSSSSRTEAHQSSLAITNSKNLPKLMSIELVMPSNHLIPCWPLLLPPLMSPSFRVFSNESALHTSWQEYWIFSISLSPSNEYSGLISFRVDWLDLFAVQGTLKSLLQHHS